MDRRYKCLYCEGEGCTFCKNNTNEKGEWCMDAQPPFIPSLKEFQEIKGGGTPRRAATERSRTALVDEYEALYPPRQRHDSSTDDDETVDLKEEKRHLQELLKIVDTKIGKKEVVTYIVVVIKSG
ncbi:hypothetical protein DMENIID0001_151330 [Sergentomyia squamirostris]